MFAVTLTLLLAAQGPAPFSRTADWESYTSGVTTGGSFADINGDGHMDMVVANGNDISRQRVEVYYNDGAGNFPNSPQWQSSDIDYHGHLAVGDVNQDGWPDVAVSVFLGPSGFGDLGRVKLYRNLGGALETSPSWESADRFYTFGCAFGDADGDGDLDLAVAVGEAYFGSPAKNRVYYNLGGTLEATPSWMASTADHSMDVMWGDLTGNGELDLAFVTAGRQNTVYYQSGGVLSTTPGWSSTDNGNQNGNNGAIADVDGDGDMDLCVSDNNQLSGGQGLYKIYLQGPGGLATNPYWSDFQGYVSAVAFADTLLDGSPDLFGGAWWGGTFLYMNQAGTFPSSPDWDSQRNSVVEALFLADLDSAGLVQEPAASFVGNSVQKLFYLPHAPIHEIQQVTVDGVVMPQSTWSMDREAGWLSLAVPPQSLLEVGYTWSTSLDLGVTNWDSSVGNLVFLRDPLVEASVTPPASSVFSGGDTISFQGHWQSTTARTESVTFAAAGFPAAGGMRVLSLVPGSLAPFGQQTIPFQIPLPAQLPPPFLGTTTFTVAALVNGAPIDSSSFQVTLQ